MLSKKNLEIIECAEVGGYNPILAGLHITPTHTITTDGKKLIMVEILGNTQEAIEEFPILPDGKGIQIIEEPFTIPKEAVKKILKNMPSKVSLPILENAGLLEVKKEKEIMEKEEIENISFVSFVSTDLETSSVTGTRVIEGKYPDFQLVIPKEEEKPIATIRFNPKLMMDLLKQLYPSKFEGDYVELSIYAQNRPMILKQKIQDLPKITALLMPIRVREEEEIEEMEEVEVEEPEEVEEVVEPKEEIITEKEKEKEEEKKIEEEITKRVKEDEVREEEEIDWIELWTRL